MTDLRHYPLSMNHVSDLPPDNLREQVAALREITREHSHCWLVFTSRNDTGVGNVAVRVQPIETGREAAFPPARQVLVLPHRRGVVLRSRDVRLIRGLLAQHGRLAVELGDAGQALPTHSL